MQTYKIAFAGLRHGHILCMYDHIKEHNRIDIVAACEEDKTTRDELIASRGMEITHSSFDRLLKETDCDIIAVGDYYSNRGSLILKALQAGKHVIADKPICTDKAELAAIREYCDSRNLILGCMLDLRDMPQFITARKLIRQGVIGEVQAIQIGGQHPLSPGSRPHWYFEAGKHGGTINDLAIHAVDLIPWITGLTFDSLLSARCWNAFVPQYPHFKDAAQFMAVMNNRAGLYCDVSYMVPDSLGYTHPLYWRITAWGRLGVIETSCTTSSVRLATARDTFFQEISLAEANENGYLKSFLNELDKTTQPDDLTTRQVLRAGATALDIQQAAEQEQFNLPLGSAF
ncbi:gfo/Idh/MocA family oxidoreductase [candidate division KSB1 bacterium]|nr:gfo/Idh/MocA family oxidoreductase [candidate division KSB1 bacterium]